MAKPLSFLQRIRNRFILSFAAVVVLLTAVVVTLIASDFRQLIDRSARTSLGGLSESIFQALFVSMNYGDSAVVRNVLKEAQNKQMVDRLDLYISREVTALFRPDYRYSPPDEIAAVFENGQEQYVDITEKGLRGIRYIKPLKAKEECLKCHINAQSGTVLGVMDLTLSLDEYDALTTLSIQRIVFSILALVGISALILNLVSNRLIFDPLEELRVATRRLANEAGDPDVRLKVRGRNEFGDVAHHFNRFITRVKEINRRLSAEEQKTRELLENREEEIGLRTKEVRQLNRELSRYVEIVDENVITSRTDTRGIITFASEAFCRISGYSKEELIGKSHNIVRHPDTPKAAFENLWSTIKQGKTWQGEIKNLKKSGGFYWVRAAISPLRDEAGKITGYVAVRQDVTLQKELEETLAKLTEMTLRSHTDALTGLMNRSRLNELLLMEIERMERYGGDLCVALLDVDHFKKINDTYGHLTGDLVLKTLAHLLQNKTRKTDLAGRWGGEEFMIVLINTTLEAALSKMEVLRRLIEHQNFEEAGAVTASFGVARFVKGDSLEGLVGRADSALYRAKAGGRNRVEVAPPEQTP